MENSKCNASGYYCFPLSINCEFRIRSSVEIVVKKIEALVLSLILGVIHL